MIEKTKTKKKPDPLPRCPRADVINVIQYQLHDNGESPGRGKSQHVMTIEVHCDGRLNLYKPYWKRAVALLAPSKFLAWATKQHAEGLMTAEQYEDYTDWVEAIGEKAREDEIEFAKLGHLGAARENTYYVGQFLAVVKFKGGGLSTFLMLDGAVIQADSFLYDQAWRPGGKRRKFFGFYDPHGMYERMKAEQRFIEHAERGGDAR